MYFIFTFQWYKQLLAQSYFWMPLAKYNSDFTGGSIEACDKGPFIFYEVGGASSLFFKHKKYRESKERKVNFQSSFYGSSRACRCWPLNFFLVIYKGKDNIFTPRVDGIKNLQEVTGRTSSPAWNLWKPFTYCSIEENSFRNLTVWNFNDVIASI